MVSSNAAKSMLIALVASSALLCSSATSQPVFDLSPRQDEGAPAYRDSTLCVEARIEDLLSRMTLEEKAGQLFHARVNMGPNGTLAEADPATGRKGTLELVQTGFMSHFNLGDDVTNVTETVTFLNNLQQAAKDTRLGIPISVSTDPRHAFTENPGTGFMASALSQWPETLGLAALRDSKWTYEFAQVAAEEYKALGIRVALHPQVDLSTEPRWGRISGTFGEDADVTSALVSAYIRGFQGDEFGRNSVSTVTKHFPGSGPVRAGNDSHFPTGKDAVYPGSNLEYHLKPFRAALAAGARQIMPYYSRPIGTPFEEVGAGLNRDIVTGLLREQLGFKDGIVVSDWGLITPFNVAGEDLEPIAWGAENLTQAERMAKILHAGTDQFGGESRYELLIELVRNGTVPESRLDTSVRRLLREKFLLGLFDNPFADPVAAERVVGNPYFVRLGEKAQRAATVLLKNKDSILPLRTWNSSSTGRMKLYTEGFNASFLSPYEVDVVPEPAEADVAILRLTTPFELWGGAFMQNYKQGTLAFNETEIERHNAIFAAVPTIVDITLDRPAVIPHIADGAAALLGNFGSNPAAMLDNIFGTDFEGVGIGAGPRGKLPFDLPKSMQDVENQKEDLPFDTVNPTYKFGDGIIGYGHKQNQQKC